MLRQQLKHLKRQISHHHRTVKLHISEGEIRKYLLWFFRNPHHPTEESRCAQDHVPFPKWSPLRAIQVGGQLGGLTNHLIPVWITLKYSFMRLTDFLVGTTLHPGSFLCPILLPLPLPQAFVDPSTGQGACKFHLTVDFLGT